MSIKCKWEWILSFDFYLSCTGIKYPLGLSAHLHYLPQGFASPSGVGALKLQGCTLILLLARCTAPSVRGKQHLCYSPGDSKPSGLRLSVLSVSRLAETHPCNLIFLPLKSAHGRLIHSPSVFHPDIRCGSEGLLGLAVHSGQRCPMTLSVFGSEALF